ncbi:PRKR-interacting protein 1 homolog [Convolutriloba macropyga]|uniref:PRKR-interacting protein 1 homolog n=1 Tax=Convolutriloba macropyga TaxID=536237 RepID=UPI003F520824
MSGSMYIPPDDEDDPKKLKRIKFLREKEEFVQCKSFSDLQRLKIERMMKHPERPVTIPERPKGPSISKPPEFIREVMGSSAAAGSGEFHVYRGIRRREQRRNQYFEALSKEEEKRLEFEARLEQNEVQSELKTSKKRQKRMKQKEKAKLAKQSEHDKSQNPQSSSNNQLSLEKYLADIEENDPNQFFAKESTEENEPDDGAKKQSSSETSNESIQQCCHLITTS